MNTELKHLITERDTALAALAKLREQTPAGWVTQAGTVTRGVAPDGSRHDGVLYGWKPLYADPRPAAAPAVPDGYKLVPLEPTEAMRNAAIREQVAMRKCSISLDGDGPATDIYKAMLAAAPTQGEQG